MAALQGYRTQQKIGQSQFQTYQQIGRAGSGSYAADTVSKVLWDTTPLNIAVEADSTKLVINATAHTAVAGDMIRFVATSANPGIEVGVVKVTANTIELGGELPALPLLADEFKIMRWITPTADQNGNLVFTPGPTTFSQNGVITTAAEDTAVPSNNRGLPVNIVFYKDGVPVTVNVDSVTPANNRLLPVELSSLAGPINVTAGDLNVSIVSTNDSTAIGDGITGDLAKVDLNDDTTTYALKVKDDDANTKLASIVTATGLGATEVTLATRASEATLDLARIAVESIAAEDFATSAKQDAQTALLTTIDADTSDIALVVNQDGTPIGNRGVAIGGVDGAGDFQQMSVNAAGELSVTFGAAGFATETTLAALNAKNNQDFGASAGAIRTAAQIGNAGGAADFNVGASGAQTLRVNSNLKREGNDLAYNQGTNDANTLRVSANIALNGTALDTDSGASSASTLRSVLATRHEAVATPLATRLSNGTDFVGTSGVVGNTQKVVSTSGTTLKAAAFALGFDSVNSIHKEILVDANGAVITAIPTLTQEDAQLTTIDESGVVTMAIPAGTRKFKVMADGANEANIRMRVDADPTAARGMQFQGGRSEDFECTGTELRFIAEVAGVTVLTQTVDVIFFKG